MQPAFSKNMSFELRSGPNSIAVVFVVGSHNTTELSYLSDKSETIPIGSYSLNNWYTIRIVADVPNRQAYFYQDGVLLAGPVPFYSPEVTGIDSVCTSRTVDACPPMPKNTPPISK